MLSPPKYGHYCQESATPGMENTGGCQGEEINNSGKKSLYSYTDKEDHDLIQMFLLFYACNLFLLI